MFLRTVKMLKATSHAKTKIKTRPGSLLTRTCFCFWIYTATAVHEAGASAPANAHSDFIPRSASDTVPASYHTPF